MQQLNVIPRSRLCDEIGVSRSTIKRWIETRRFPKPLQASGQGYDHAVFVESLMKVCWNTTRVVIDAITAD